MTNIYSHDTINERPFFSNQETLPLRPTQSCLEKNPLFNRLKPHKHRSKFADFFRRLWRNFVQYFQVKFPNIIKENFVHLIKSNDSLSSGLTIGNLWHHYSHFLSEDTGCPPGLKSCFEKMERDEKDLLKIARLKEKKKEKKFLEKAAKKIENMPVGKSRLFLLSRTASSDNSLNGDLFCTLTRTKTGYTLRFIGSGPIMEKLDDAKAPLAGKQKVTHTISFENIPSDAFTDPKFLDSFLMGWAHSNGQDVFKLASAFPKKAANSLEDYTTQSKRPDKLFWNIVLSLPEQASEETVTRSSVRTIRLRAELLTLFEAFDDARLDLDPKTRSYRNLKKLSTDVASKALLYYRKNYISDGDFDTINKRLMIIDEALRKAKQEPSALIPSKISLEKQTFFDVSFKKAFIHPPQAAAPLPNIINEPKKVLLTEPGLESLPIEPIPLSTFKSIDTPEAFLKNLSLVHNHLDKLKNGTLQEKDWAVREVFRFFHEVPFSDEYLRKDYAKNLNCFWWKLEPNEARQAMQIIVELTEAVAQVKTPVTIFQYDFEALINMQNIVTMLNAHRTGSWIGWPVDMPGGIIDRFYQRVRYVDQAKFVYGLFSRIYIHHKNSHPPEFLDDKDDPLTLPLDSYDLVIQQMRTIQTLLPSSGYGFRRYEFGSQVSPENWIRPMHNAYLNGLYSTCLTDQSHVWKDRPSEAVPEAFFDNPEEIFRQYNPKDRHIKQAPFSLELPGAPKELKALSRLLREKSPHIEFLSFMKEYPHLLYNLEIRNFFDALFFGKDLKSTLEEYGLDKSASIFPKIIESEIERLISDFKNQLKHTPIEDSDLLKARFDTVLYYNEMQIRLKEGFLFYKIPTHDFPSLEKRLHDLCELCRTTPELNASLGYATRLQLRLLLNENQVNSDHLSQIIPLLAVARASYIDPMQLEPSFEYEI